MESNTIRLFYFIYIFSLRFHRFLKNMTGHNAVINSISVNEDGVMVSCADNGSIAFWDYESGYCFQKSNTIVQPGNSSFI